MTGSMPEHAVPVARTAVGNGIGLRDSKVRTDAEAVTRHGYSVKAVVLFRIVLHGRQVASRKALELER